MSRPIAAAAALFLLATAAGAAPAAPPSGPPSVKTVTLLVGHRVFPDYREVVTVPLGKEFQVGESEFTARITQFVADFAMDPKGRVVSRSNVPRNPAVRIVVRQQGAPKDTSWAFVNYPPHFSRNSMLSFRVVRIEFRNAPPITVVPDTTRTNPRP